MKPVRVAADRWNFETGSGEYIVPLGGNMLNDEHRDWGALTPETLNGTPRGFYLYVNDADAWQKRALEAGAKEVMPVQDMFWGDKMGCVLDPFGHKWNIATHVRDLSVDEIKKGQDAWMREMAAVQKH